MKLCLVSDGTPPGSRVVCAGTGEPLEGVVEFHLCWREGGDDSRHLALMVTVIVPAEEEAAWFAAREKEIDREVAHGEPGA